MYFMTGLQNEGGEKMGCVEWKSTTDDRWNKFILMINGWSVLNKRVLLMIDEESSLVYSDDGIIHVVIYWLGTYVWTHDSYACVPYDWMTKWRVWK